MNIISNLDWECKNLSEKVTSLDLDININRESKTFDYKVHAKEEALALYTQPHSAHPPNTSKRMVFNLLNTYCSHNSNKINYSMQANKLLNDLLKEDIIEIRFLTCLKKRSLN